MRRRRERTASPSSPTRAAGSSRTPSTTGPRRRRAAGAARPSRRSCRGTSSTPCSQVRASLRRDADRIPAAMLALAAARALAAGRDDRARGAALPALARCHASRRTQAGDSAPQAQPRHEPRAHRRPPRRPRRDHGARAGVVPDRRVVRRDDARGARLAARLVRRRRRGRAGSSAMPACARSRGASDADIQTITIAEGSRGRGRGRALLTPCSPRRHGAASRRGVPRGARRQPRRAGALRLGGLRRGRPPPEVLPARRRRRAS